MQILAFSQVGGLLCRFSWFPSGILLCCSEIKTEAERGANPTEQREEITNHGVLKISLYSEPGLGWEVLGETGMGWGKGSLANSVEPR